MRVIDGMFPDEDSSGHFCSVRNSCFEVLPNGSGKWIQPSEMTELIQTACKKAMAAHAGYFNTGGAFPSWFGPHSCTVTGDGMRIPSYINPELFPRVKSNTGLRWATHKRTSDIIVTNTLRGSLQIDFVPGLKVVNKLGSNSPNVFAKDTGLFPVTKDGYVIVSGRTFVSIRIYKLYTRMIVKEQSDPRPQNWSPKTYEYLLKGSLVQQQILEPMVMENLSKANASTVELLSTMAEMPMTVASILHGIQTIIKMYKETRKKAFRIYNKGGAGSKANTAWRNSKECADAIVKVWMTWRFEIRPNVYLLEDAIDILYSDAKEFIRFREFRQETFTVPSPGLPVVDSADVPIQHRCMIKRCFDISRPESLLAQRLTLNGAIALYELTPMSWALDYFVNLGDFIGSRFNITPALAEGSTYSWKVPKSTVSFGNASTGYIKVTLALYRRDVIDPSSITCLNFNPDLDFAKYSDLASVGWNLFKNELPTDIKRKYKKIPYTE